MTTLKEIEANLEGVDAVHTIVWTGSGQELDVEEDMRLLIRAVRQLGELAEARRGERAFAKLTVYNEENWRKASDRLNNAVRLDPDVLALLEEGR